MQIKHTFSIIIPAYNSESYIHRSLDSLVSTGLNSNQLEVIVVDDGSVNDLTKIICDEYSSSNKLNIIYKKKKNGNWGSVINYVKHNKLATGDIISILDSDDFYSKNVFKHISNKIGNADFVIGNFRMFNGRRRTIRIATCFLPFTHHIKNPMKKIFPFCLPLPYFFSKELFYSSDDLREGCAYQDADLSTHNINSSKKMVYINRVLGYYFHNRVGNSMHQKWNDHRIEALVYVFNKCIAHNAQEEIVYQMLISKDLGRALKKMSKNGFTFIVHRKFKFAWFPFFIRWIFILVYHFNYRKIFQITHKSP